MRPRWTETGRITHEAPDGSKFSISLLHCRQRAAGGVPIGGPLPMARLLRPKEGYQAAAFMEDGDWLFGVEVWGAKPVCLRGIEGQVLAECTRRLDEHDWVKGRIYRGER